MPISLAELLHKIEQYNSDSDLQQVSRAYRYALDLHSGQQGKTGAPFVEHIVEVATLLTDLKLDNTTVSAALLHHALDKGKIQYETLESQFGKDLADIVDGVTKLGQLAFQGQEGEETENLRKMILAMAKDLRVILIKICDRLQDMRTLKHHNKAEQRRVAQETMDIYAPLANRLGIAKVKWELEDLSLFHLEPEVFHEIRLKVVRKRRERESYVEEAKATLKKLLEEHGIQGTISGRPKHFYSIYRKMLAQGIDVSQVFDLAGVRILTQTVAECYAVLGIIHTRYMPIAGRFRDYVAMPKPNMYQSLHTTVNGPRGRPLEVQIRTEEMHRIAEEGIAAHWKYKESDRRSRREDEKTFLWLRQIMDLRRELKNPQEFASSLKIELFPKEVYVFTPKGDVKALKRGSTPVDFAFAIHTEVGRTCRGAKVSGKMVPLRTELRNGDIVEILTSKNQTPSPDWLDFVKTSKAKTKIRQTLKAKERDHSIAAAKETLARELKRDRIDFAEVLRSDAFKSLTQRLSFTSIDDMLAALGFGKLRLGSLINPLLDIFKPTPQKTAESERSKTTIQQVRSHKRPDAVRVRGIDGILTRFAKCCAPVPGDPIVGVITRARGVSIHHADCKNVERDPALTGTRLIEVDWDREPSGGYMVKLEIIAYDRPGLFADVTGTISKHNANIVDGRMETNEFREASGLFVLEINDLGHVRRIAKALRKIKGVTEVRRLMQGVRPQHRRT